MMNNLVRSSSKDYFLNVAVIIPSGDLMRFSRITILDGVFLLVTCLAIGVRILNLGAAPLTDFEAEQALQAFQISKGGDVDLTSGPAYAFLTGATFFIFADSNFYARLWPLIAGCCLVLFAYLIRSIIGRKASLILAIGFALDAGLVAFSRTVNQDILVVGFGALALGLLYNRRFLLAGIFIGLMVLSGPAAIQGLLGFGLTWILGRSLRALGIVQQFPSSIFSERTKLAWRPILIGVGGVVVVFGTLFFQYPSGLDALTGVIPAYLGGGVSSSLIQWTRLIAVLVFYHPIVLIFGLSGIIRGWRRKNALLQWLSLSAVIYFFLAGFYPGRQVNDLMWMIVPLWTLAAIEISYFIRLTDAELLPAIGQALLITLLIALGWINLAGLGGIGGGENSFLRWAVIGGTILLAAVTTVLISLGWSIKTAQLGLVWGLLIGLSIYSVATMWGISQVRPNGEQELISSFPTTKNVADFEDTLAELSKWRTGFDESLDIVVTTWNPSLRWVLRNWPQAKYLSAISPGMLPEVIIKPSDQSAPELSIGYRGQDFAWWTSPAWSGAVPENWPRWLVFRDAPSIDNHIVLWARGDLFPGGTLALDESDASETGEEFPIEGLPVK